MIQRYNCSNMKKQFRSACYLFISLIVSATLHAQTKATNKKNIRSNGGSWERLRTTAATAGKKEWRPMLLYLAQLHQTNTHPATWPFDYEWEGLGPG